MARPKFRQPGCSWLTFPSSLRQPRFAVGVCPLAHLLVPTSCGSVVVCCSMCVERGGRLESTLLHKAGHASKKIGSKHPIARRACSRRMGTGGMWMMTFPERRFGCFRTFSGRVGSASWNAQPPQDPHARSSHEDRTSKDNNMAFKP